MRPQAAGLSRGLLSVLAGVGSLALGVALSSSGCGEGNPGFDPPNDALAFPSGLLLDPRVSTAIAETGEACTSDADCGDEGRGVQCRDIDPDTLMGTCWARERARWLLVTNANSDRRFNAGSLLAIDLDAVWVAFRSDDVRGATASLEGTSDPNRLGENCRRVANLPQTVECLEEPFVAADATIHFGNFPTSTAAWVPNPSEDAGIISEEAMLLVPVRGDPSVTYAMLSGGLGGSDDLRFECGQASDEDGGRRCDDDHRLRFLRNDPDASRMAREPFRVLVSPAPEPPVAFVSHQGDPDVTVIALDGLNDENLCVDADGDKVTVESGRPAIVHQASLLFSTVTNAIGLQGGFGLAQRPCDVDSGNAPNSTLGCTRPLLYSSIRWDPRVRSFTAVTHDPLPETPSPDGSQTYPGQCCVVPETLGAVGGVICDPQAEPVRDVQVGELSLFSVPLSPSRPYLADIGFSRSGNELYVVQSNPGALLRIDTSIGPDGETVDVPAGAVEVCSQPTSFARYDDGDSEFGLVTCYRSGELFIVDLASLTVVGVSRAGIGPDSMAVDLGREVVYVANSLDATVSVIDMSAASPTRFTQIARIGIQEPYVK